MCGQGGTKQILLPKMSKNLPKMAIFGHFQKNWIFESDIIVICLHYKNILFIICWSQYPKWPTNAKKYTKLKFQFWPQMKLSFIQYIMPPTPSPHSVYTSLKFYYFLIVPIILVCIEMVFPYLNCHLWEIKKMHFLFGRRSN